MLYGNYGGKKKVCLIFKKLMKLNKQKIINKKKYCICTNLLNYSTFVLQITFTETIILTFFPNLFCINNHTKFDQETFILNVPHWKIKRQNN